MIESRKAYKNAIKCARKKHSEIRSRRVESLLDQNNNDFWKRWRKYKNKPNKLVDLKQNAIVANELLQNFSKKYIDSKNDVKLFGEIVNKYEVSGNLYRHSHKCMTSLKIEEIEIAANQLHKNRAKDRNNVSAEHIVFCSPYSLLSFK